MGSSWGCHGARAAVAQTTATQETQKGPAASRALHHGAGEENRTPDLRITNALLYQLSYTGANRKL